MSRFRKLSLVVIVGAVLPLTGCGQDADGLAQQQIDEMNELAAALEAGASMAF